MNKKYDWPVIERYFFNFSVSLKTVSEKYNIPYQTVRRYAAQNNWRKRKINKAEVA